MPKKKILIAEDEKPMSKALQLKLTNAGFQTDTAYDGEEAIAKLKKGKYDLLLLDLMMPKVDGFGVLEDMNKREDKTPVIISSNLSQETDMEKTKELGAKDFFVKSDTPILKVVEHVKNILEKYGSQ